MQRKAIVLCGLLGWAAASAAPAEQLVIMTATGADLEVGTVIEGAERLVLPAAAAVTLVAKSGQLIELVGPYEGTPAPGAEAESSDPKLLDAVSQLVRGGAESTDIGAFRGEEDSGGPPHPVLIDPSRNGHYCVPAEGVVTLWRPDAEGESMVRIQHAKTRARAEAFWEEGEETVAWPEDLPPEDGATYAVRLKGSMGRELTLHLMPSDLPGDKHRIVWMLGRDCLSQARMLLDRIQDAAAGEDARE